MATKSDQQAYAEEAYRTGTSTEATIGNGPPTIPKKPGAKIHHPRNNRNIPAVRFMATGIASPLTGPILGILEGDKGTTADGLVLREPPAYSHWLIYFSFALDDLPKQHETFTLRLCSRLTGRLLDKVEGLTFVIPFVLMITSPSLDPLDDKQCPDTFTPYGSADTADFPILSVRMTPANGSAIDANFIFEDPQNSFWSATFPTIPTSGNPYTLKVTGSSSSSPSRPGLIMDQTLC